MANTYWLSIKYIKESYPLYVANYLVPNNISEGKYFSRWVNHKIDKCYSMIKDVTIRYWRRTHAFEVNLIDYKEDALDIDIQKGGYFFHKDVKKVMKMIPLLLVFLMR